MSDAKGLLTVTSLLAVCWEEIEENLNGMSARLEHSRGNRNSREYFHHLL
jgi:hypothetical protein